MVFSEIGDNSSPHEQTITLLNVPLQLPGLPRWLSGKESAY